MKILSIDTTAMTGSVALSEDAKLIAQEQQGVPGTHSERLISSIEHLLQIAGWNRKDVEAIAVAIGPGSFTGLRIGLATAKGIAIANGCAIAGVSSLMCLALNGSGFNGTVVPLIDARRGEIYMAAYQFQKNGRPKEVVEECVLPPDEVARRLSKLKGELLLVGDGAIEYGKKLVSKIGKRALVPQDSTCYPQAINLAILAMKDLGSAGARELNELAPNYIRRSDAEIGFQAKHKPKRKKKAARRRRR